MLSLLLQTKEQLKALKAKKVRMGWAGHNHSGCWSHQRVQCASCPPWFHKSLCWLQAAAATPHGHQQAGRQPAAAGPSAAPQQAGQGKGGGVPSAGLPSDFFDTGKVGWGNGTACLQHGRHLALARLWGCQIWM